MMDYKDGSKVLSLVQSKNSFTIAAPFLEVEIDIGSVGLSLIGKDNVRKELLFCRLEEINFKYGKSKN